MPLRMTGNGDIQHSIDYPAEIDQPSAVVSERFYAFRLEGFLDEAGLAHLLGCRYSVDCNHIHRGPFELVQGGFVNTGRHYPGIHRLAAEMPVTPGVIIPVSAPGTLPRTVRAKKGGHPIRSHCIQFSLHQRALVGSTESPGLVPAGTGPQNDLIDSLPDEVGDIVDHDQGSLVQLRNCRIEYGLGNPGAIDVGFVITKGVDIEQCFTRFPFHIKFFPQER